jgi:hypothetical protein
MGLLGGSHGPRCHRHLWHPLAMQGQAEERTAQMRHALAAWRAIGADSRVALAGLAGGGVWARRTGRGGTTPAGRGGGARGQHREHKYAAEVYWLKGELLLRQAIPDEAQAETCLHQAVDVARQEAKSQELCAATSLARLWLQQGKRSDAHALLAPVYRWFTEGFDITELQEAKGLLEELS